MNNLWFLIEIRTITILPVKMMSVYSEKTAAPRFGAELSNKTVTFRFTLSQCT